MSRRVGFVLVVVVAAAAGACNLFGQIRCDKDSDCPDNLPFCNANVCGKTADDGRHGRGVGEGEGEGEGGGACTTDSDCGTGLCYDVDDALAIKGTCVPQATDKADCAEVSLLGGVDGPNRASGGSVIFKGTATFSGGDCSPGTQNINLEIHFLDRESDFDPTGTQAFVMPPGGTSPAETGGGSIETSDGKTGDAFLFDRECVDSTADHVAVRLGTSLPTSNTLCLPITAAP